MKRESVLVVGATGFIGRRLVARLAREYGGVLCLALRDRGQHQRMPQGVTAVVADSLRPADLGRALEQTRADVVVNVAAAGVLPGLEDPGSLIAGNVDVVEALLTALEPAPPRLFLQAGSWSEYSAAVPGVPVAESHTSLPTSLYGAVKAAATIVGNALARTKEIPFVTMRMFNVYGPGEAPTRLLPYLIGRLGDGQPVDLTPGAQVRDFVYIDDVVEAFIVAARPGALEAYSVYNICSGIPTSVRHIAESTADTMKKSRDLLLFGRRAHRSDEPLWVVGDGRRFEAATGWRPQVSIEEGIRRTVAESGR